MSGVLDAGEVPRRPAPRPLPRGQARDVDVRAWQSRSPAARTGRRMRLPRLVEYEVPLIRRPPLPGTAATATGSSPRGCLVPLLLAILALAAAVVALADHGGQSSGGAAAPVAVPAPSGAPAPEPAVAPGDDPWGLGRPTGTEPRVRELQVVWLVSDEVAADPSLAATLAEEAPVAVDQFAAHGMPLDGLAIGAAPLMPVGPNRDVLREQAMQIVGGGDPQAAVTHAMARLAAFPDDDGLIVVVTTAPERWEAFLPQAAPIDFSVSPADAPISRRSTLLAPRPGAALQTGPGRFPASPDVVDVQPTVGGELAEGLARAWASAAGSGYEEA